MSDQDDVTWPEHPSVSVVEEILVEATARSGGTVPTRDGRAVADRAIWFCACSTDEQAAPTWVIYDTDDGGVGWCRVPDGLDTVDVVDAPLVVGDHVSPEEVLEWLTQDRDSDWVPSDNSFPREESGDRLIIQQVGRRIRELR